MKKIVFAMLALMCAGMLHAERTEKVAYGDFEHWTVRYIKESGLIGGKTKTLYIPCKTDTLHENSGFRYGRHGSPWASANAYAKVAGIEKASMSVQPEKRGNGWCARLDCKVDGVTVLGCIDLKVFVAGTLYTGKLNEPVSKAGANDPYSVVDMGIPFTKHPIALVLDYKAIVENSNEITYAKATAHPKKQTGHDEAEFYIYLQKRWEDAEGNIHALRVATAYERISQSVPNWQNNHRIPIRWGDISKQPGYKDYEGLNKHSFRTKNSQGKMVRIQEDGWSNEEPTHMILMLTAGKYEAFVGHEGNVLWVDNVRLVYEN